eukprot:gene35133-42552_t
MMESCVAGRYQKTFYERQLKPLFVHRYAGEDSDEEDTEQQKREKREARRKERREEKELNMKIQSFEKEKEKANKAEWGKKSEDGPKDRGETREEMGKSTRSVKFGINQS